MQNPQIDNFYVSVSIQTKLRFHLHNGVLNFGGHQAIQVVPYSVEFIHGKIKCIKDAWVISFEIQYFSFQREEVRNQNYVKKN